MAVASGELDAARRQHLLAEHQRKRSALDLAAAEDKRRAVQKDRSRCAGIQNATNDLGPGPRTGRRVKQFVQPYLVHLIVDVVQFSKARLADAMYLQSAFCQLAFGRRNDSVSP